MKIIDHSMLLIIKVLIQWHFKKDLYKILITIQLINYLLNHQINK
jgi:hypothetical protein